MLKKNDLNDDIGPKTKTTTFLHVRMLCVICSEFYQRFCLTFNAIKSKVMVFGKLTTNSSMPLTLNGSHMEYVNEWKYLGTTIKSGCSLGFSARPDLASFFRATNSLIYSLPGAHEHTLVTLLYTNCVPILTYGCAVKEYSAQDMTSCNTAVNSVLRKVFGFSRWESISTLREVFCMKSLYDIFKSMEENFYGSCRAQMGGSLIAHLRKILLD